MKNKSIIDCIILLLFLLVCNIYVQTGIKINKDFLPSTVKENIVIKFKLF